MRNRIADLRIENYRAPAVVHSEVYKLLSSARDGRGVVVSTAEAFGPETPEANLYALSQAVRDWRELS